MRPRDSIVAWRNSDAWTSDAGTYGQFALEPCGNARLTTGYYLLVPVESEKAGLELAKRLSAASSGDAGSSGAR